MEEIESNHTHCLDELNEYNALYAAAISTFDLEDDKQLVHMNYDEDPPTKLLIQDYKLIDRQGYIAHNTSFEEQLKLAKFAKSYFEALTKMDVVITTTEMTSLF
jgi:hypothetical protein